jgi:hypothetical protein
MILHPAALFRRLKCRLGHHYRDGYLARKAGEVWISSCVVCGARMIRTPEGWRLHDVRRKRLAKHGLGIVWKDELEPPR